MILKALNPVDLAKIDDVLRLCLVVDPGGGLRHTDQLHRIRLGEAVGVAASQRPVRRQRVTRRCEKHDRAGRPATSTASPALDVAHPDAPSRTAGGEQ